jgi:chromosome segregation ATPase
LIGAVLFALGGYFLARRQRVSAPELARSDPFRDDGTVDALSQELDNAKAREAKLGRELASLKEWRGTKEPELARLSQEATALRTQIETATRERDGALQMSRALQEALAGRDEEEEADEVTRQEPDVPRLAVLEEQLSLLRTEHARVEAERADFAGTVEAQQRALERAAAEKKSLQNKAAQLEQAAAGAKPASAAPSGQQQEALRKAQTEATTLRAQAEVLQRALEKAKTEIATLAAEKSARESQRAEAAKKAEKDLAASLQTTQGELNRTQTELKKALQAAQEAAALRQQARGAAQDLEEAKRSTATLRDQVKRLESQLDAAKSGAKELKRALLTYEEEHTAIEHYKVKLATADGKVAQVDRMTDERYELKQQLKELEQEVERLRKLEPVADERHDLALRVESLKQKEQEANAIREEKTRLADELRGVRKEEASLMEKVKDLERVTAERQDLAIKVQSLSVQIQALEQLREENSSLRSKMAEVADLSAQLETLRSENANLRSLGLVKTKPARPVLTGTPESLGGSLQSLVESLSREDKARGAALADESGLVVAGTGDHAEALAAAAATLVDSATRVLRNLVKIGRLQQLSVVDENALTITAHPFTLAEGENTGVSSELILATLTIGPGPDSQKVGALLAKAPPRGRD